MRSVIVLAVAALSFAAGPPSGFRKIFNGRDLTGWHVSQSSPPGNTRGWTAKSGILTGTENPVRNGGLLLTDRKYHNFEISLDVQPDFGSTGGILLRSSEKGEALEVMVDYLDTLGTLRSPGADPLFSRKWASVWKRGDWNHIRARIEGECPRIQVWLNDTPLLDQTMGANPLPSGATEGYVGLSIYPSRDSVHRFRNIAIKELP